MPPSSSRVLPHRSAAARGEESRVLALLGWAGRTDVERVQRYTQWSLHVMLWLFIGFYAAPVLVRLDGPVEVAGTVAVLLLLALAGSRGVKESMRRWPARGVPWRERWLHQVLVALVLGTAWTAVVDQPDHVGWPLGVAMVAAWALGGLRQRGLHVVVLSGCFLLGWGASHFSSVGLGLVVTGFAAFMLFTMQSSLWLLGVVRELDRARATEAELAVAHERLRFSTDVHDVLGRHLSTIAVQAELAGALLKRGDDRALERIEQVRTSAHEALREARELARGYRPPDLTQEVQGAVSLLASAGAEVTVTPSPLAAALAPDWHEPVARLVRESVTNVLRHSRARRVAITLEGSVLRVANDGVAADVAGDAAGSPALPGNGGLGLTTLATDLSARGGRLTSSRDGETFTLVLELPAGARQERSRR